MHTFTVALAIVTVALLGGCGSQDGGARAEPALSAATPPGPSAPAAPVTAPAHADVPASPPAAPPASGNQPGAQPGALAVGPSATTAPGLQPSAGPPSAAPTNPAAAPTNPAAAPSATQSTVDAAAERDLRISREVRAGLTRDGHLARDSRNVEVSTSAGVVTLTGTVTSDADRRAIRSQAERVSGVVRVEDQLVVR